MEFFLRLIEVLLCLIQLLKMLALLTCLGFTLIQFGLECGAGGVGLLNALCEFLDLGPSGFKITQRLLGLFPGLIAGPGKLIAILRQLFLLCLEIILLLIETGLKLGQLPAPGVQFGLGLIQLFVLGVKLLAERFVGLRSLLGAGGITIQLGALLVQFILLIGKLFTQGLCALQFLGGVLRFVLRGLDQGLGLVLIAFKLSVGAVQFGLALLGLFQAFLRLLLLFVGLLLGLIELVLAFFELSLGRLQGQLLLRVFLGKLLGLLLLGLGVLGLLADQFDLLIAFLLPILQLPKPVFQLIEQVLDLAGVVASVVGRVWL